ncbi:urea transporter [uncultured Muribaculum sp.]|uniref:urea transporter n=1 Tax=uncultured Muribaculum sp. TaxID=1918613 RepID=UPI0025A9AC91|nr:urea transporter [uncultured Muribaculum sp.]
MNPRLYKNIFRIKTTTCTFLHGVGQVMFQPCALTGLLFLAGISWGAYECGAPQAGWGAVIGTAVATATGFLAYPDKKYGSDGLWGFNGTLVGCALPAFLANTTMMWVTLIFFAMLTTWLQRGLNRIMLSWKINSLTFPFVFLTWIVLMASQQFNELPPVIHTAIAAEYSPTSLAIYWLKGISQVFLINSWVTGIFFIAALALSNLSAAIWAMTGSGIGLLFAIQFGAAPETIANGLYGFSPVLTAIAIGCTFSKPGTRTTIVTLAAIVTTVFIQGAMNELMLPWGIPTLTAPFCIATWLFQLSGATAGNNADAISK